ncbi:cation:proton antiporter [Halomonas sp. GXIMD04776]|uniref:cation:proton antiporter n=1 Tax=Halomonas sp. GXIMD04776 TaxID=3415605 RepID=UPI003C91A9D9
MDGLSTTTLLILFIGLSTSAAMLLRAGCERIGIPPLVGFLLLGVGISTLDASAGIINVETEAGIELLAQLGLVALLFRVGLGLDPRRLLAKLPSASVIWLGNITIAGLTGYAVSQWVLGLELIPSLVIAVALTATSIGVIIPVWEEAGVLNNDAGTLTVDVAELDDISGIVLMVLLFAVLPVLQSGDGAFWLSMGAAAGELALLFIVFIIFCWLFARYLTPRLYRFLHRWERTPEHLLTVIALGAVIAGIAEVLGFSLAVGALFAGIVFSAYPEQVRSNDAYGLLYDFFTPYFFVAIGLHLDPTLILPALGVGLVLLIAAVAGKLIGTYLPARLMTDRDSAWLIAVSMVPRAEIAMVIVHQAYQLGPWAIDAELYGAMAVVALATCLFTPLLLGRLLARSA